MPFDSFVDLYSTPILPLHDAVKIKEEAEAAGNASVTVIEEGLYIKSCSDHWPGYNFLESQPWCCDAWCYVVGSCATAATSTAQVAVRPGASERCCLQLDLNSF